MRSNQYDIGWPYFFSMAGKNAARSPELVAMVRAYVLAPHRSSTHVPIEAVCTQLEHDLLTAVGDPDPPRLPEPVDGYLW
jgi:hypothetical protein